MTTAAPEKPKPKLVWRWPGAAQKAHVFEAIEARSLCGRWLYAGNNDDPVGELGEKPGKDDCTPCWRAARERLA